MKDLIDKFNREGVVVFGVKVRAGAGRTAIVGATADGVVKMEVKASPEKGKANEDIIGYFSKLFNVDKINVKIIVGKSKNRKIVKILN